MNDETSMQPSDSSPSEIGPERMRDLLAAPKPRDAAWQDEAGRGASLLAVSFAQEADERTALLKVALVSLAAAKGVKDAKKRSIRLARWAERPPPSLETLGSVGEQRAAVTALEKIRAPWADAYVREALLSDKLPTDLSPELLRWARSSSAGWASFVGGIYSEAIEASADPIRANLLLKDGLRVLAGVEPSVASEAAEALGRLTRAVVSASEQAAANPRLARMLLASGFAIVHQSWQAFPALLLQPAFISTYKRLATASSAGKKAIPPGMEAASTATLTLITDSIRRFGAQATEQWRSLVPMLGATYPNFLKQLKVASCSDTSLAPLVEPESTPPVGSGDDSRYAAESAFAALLPAWEAFAAGLPEGSGVESLTNMVKRAAATACVESLGATSDVAEYDPLAHHLAGADENAPVRVEVVRPGAVVRRADGSVRILVRALVRASSG